jgi:hypothetical protein
MRVTFKLAGRRVTRHVDLDDFEDANAGVLRRFFAAFVHPRQNRFAAPPSKRAAVESRNPACYGFGKPYVRQRQPREKQRRG